VREKWDNARHSLAFYLFWGSKEGNPWKEKTTCGRFAESRFFGDMCYLSQRGAEMLFEL